MVAALVVLVALISAVAASAARVLPQWAVVVAGMVEPHGVAAE